MDLGETNGNEGIEWHGQVLLSARPINSKQRLLAIGWQILSKYSEWGLYCLVKVHNWCF
jgi:hypothetical protein